MWMIYAQLRNTSSIYLGQDQCHSEIDLSGLLVQLCAHSPVAMGELYLDLANKIQVSWRTLFSFLRLLKEIHVFLINLGNSLQCSYHL